MADVLLLEFETDEAAALYERVNGLIGVDAKGGGGGWPDALSSHVAGVSDDGHLFVIESWESKAEQEKFMAERLGPALHQAGAPQPKKIQWLTWLGEKK